MSDPKNTDPYEGGLASDADLGTSEDADIETTESESTGPDGSSESVTRTTTTRNETSYTEETS